MDGIQDGALGATPSVATWIDDVGTNAFNVKLVRVGDGGPNGIWGPKATVSGRMMEGKVYRFEYQVEAVTDTTHRLHVRVYDDGADTLVYSDADYDNGAFGDGQTTLADNPVMRFTNGIESTAGYLLGVNSFDMGGSYPYMEIGNLAICAQEWCGRYPIEGVEGSSGSGGAITVYAHLDWSTATGNTSAAFLDSNKPNNWSYGVGTLANGGNSEVRVTATDGRDYPTTNYLRVKDDYGLLLIEDESFIPATNVGDTIYVRYYERILIDNSLNWQSHDIYFQEDQSGWGPLVAGQYLTGSSGSSSFSWKLSAAQWQDPRYFMPASDGGSPEILLSKNTTYRYEFAVARTSATTYTLQGRIYNLVGTLLYDTEDLNGKPFYGSSGPSIPLTDQTFTITSGAFVTLEGFSLGKEDGEGTGSEWAEYAAFAICDTWCGPYPIAGVEN